MPLYYNYKNTGRPGADGADAGSVVWSHYGDEKNSPLYPFGYGLSYTTFEYSEIQISSSSLSMNTEIQASVVLKNTGKYKGKEVVQLYIKDHYASTIRPVKELKGFDLIELKPGESRKVTFVIDAELLQFYSARKIWEAEPGAFSLFIGSNSSTKRMVDFELN